MQWTDEASKKFTELLTEIPAFMRGMAEQMGRNEIARVAAARGATQVDMPTMVIGLIKATPPNLKEQMKQAMVRHGIDLAPYSEFL